MNLQTRYIEEIKPKLKQELVIANVMAIPKLIKIVVNVGLGEALADKKVIEKVSSQLQVITGQKPGLTRAKVSIAAFKLRAGEPVGLRVTLRGKRMYDFMEKLIAIVLPRVRDFRGLSVRGFDGRGNYSLGLQEQILFPEVEYSSVDKVRGLEITIVTSAGNNKAGHKLLQELGFPFEKEKSKA